MYVYDYKFLYNLNKLKSCVVCLLNTSLTLNMVLGNCVKLIKPARIDFVTILL
jgi:hypothetical protein